MATFSCDDPETVKKLGYIEDALVDSLELHASSEEKVT